MLSTGPGNTPVTKTQCPPLGTDSEDERQVKSQLIMHATTSEGTAKVWDLGSELRPSLGVWSSARDLEMLLEVSRLSCMNSH